MRLDWMAVMARFISQVISTSRSMTFHQITNRVLLIRPTSFGFNKETAVSNTHQIAPKDNSPDILAKISEDALKEFRDVKTSLESCGIQVNQETDRDDVKLPDSVFPNNWISFHSSLLPSDSQPTIVVYPMNSPSRRLERQDAIITKWRKKLSANLVDLSKFENDGMFLEGTGSLVLDRVNRIVYAAISPRTTKFLVENFCERFNYKPVIFHTSKLSPEYHTNVVMSVAEELSLICLDCIEDELERQFVQESIQKSGKIVIPISKEQMNNFSGNCLQLRGKENKSFLFMSTKAYSALEEWQKSEISKFSEIIHIPIDVIETYGGGSVRCMIAEVFPPLD